MSRQIVDGQQKKNRHKINLKVLSMKPEALSNASKEREACRLCGLYGNAHTPFMRPFIPKSWTGKLLGLGEGPGEHEDEESHRPFTGPAGRLLRRLVKKARFKEQDVALHNAVRCRPRNNATPTMQQIRCCRPFVLQIIRKLRPKVVIALGASAMRSLRNLGESNVTKNRGKQLQIPGLK